MSRLALHVALALLLAFVALRALRAPASEFGDGREYVLQSQAIVFDHSLAVDPARRVPYFNETNPFGLQLDASRTAPPDPDAEGEDRQFGGTLGSLYLSSDGSYRYIHPWVYSLAVAPVYAVLHLLSPGPNEYLAFRITNIIVLFVPLVLLWRRSPSWETLLFLVVLLASPISPHLQFSHPEAFCLGLVLASFASARPGRFRVPSPFLLGVAAAQNVPIALFFPLHFWLLWREAGVGRGEISARLCLRALLPYAAAATLPAALLLYSSEHFGALSLIAHLGQADFSYLSARKLLAVFISPMIGCLWYLPASWLAVLVALGRGQLRQPTIFVVSVIFVAALSSTTANINSAQLSACRYAVWYLGPLYVLPFLFRRGAELRLQRRETFIFSAGLLLVALIWLQLGTWRFLNGESFRFLSSQRAVPEVAALYRLTHLHDDVEPMVENIRQREIPVAHRFRGIYIWNLGEGQSVWIVTQRAMNTSHTIEVRVVGDLASAPEVTSAFEISQRSGDLFRLTLRSGTSFHRHPYLGGYLLLWVPVRVEGVRSEAPVVLAPTVRPSTTP